ncbi:N-acetylneuraminate lyase [Acetatifactor muris]|uniref:N-acetylneuraminate lyase n=1 Tax=Acetatifactor muris TaxID=879566 RepID=A0A2K4ZPT2_9FIRM|nr:N-acetylneuraminate lyase [Acetatifactor muris]MCI8800500.1 N-acetylneuraminate lyase [Lachnospiraceae bacterium]MCR2050898.1 N-acetylneuraminate lyase [Acetatifactor muris]SOY32446.1 N-acetylneuraminate lyase [Acetatifactor muris]
MSKFNGICAALLTPYDMLGKVNYKMLKQQVRWLIGQGIDGFYVCGSTGEAFLLSMEERKAILEAVCEENNGEKLIIAHIGQIATEHSLELGRHAGTLKVDAVSSISPFYYKFSTEEIKGYYLDLMEGIQIPFFIYNFPAYSGFSLTPELLDEMCANPYLAGVKFTASDFFQLERMKYAHPDLAVWNGYDEMLVSGLSSGADGGIGSTYNILCPAVRGIYDSFRAGHLDQAREYQHLVNGVISVLCRYGVFASLKVILGFLGMEFGGCRKPFLPVEAAAEAALKEMYRAYLRDLEKMG